MARLDFHSSASGFDSRPRYQGPMDVLGVVAALSRRRSRVQIPLGSRKESEPGRRTGTVSKAARG